jgi:hypothetical protein
LNIFRFLTMLWVRDYTAIGISNDDPDVVKGRFTPIP